MLHTETTYDKAYFTDRDWEIVGLSFLNQAVCPVLIWGKIQDQLEQTKALENRYRQGVTDFEYKRTFFTQECYVRCMWDIL